MPEPHARLRVGLLLDSLTVPRWVHSILEEIERGEDARIELVILNEAETPRRTLVHRIRDAGHFLFSAYAHLDRWLFAPRARENAFDAADAGDLLRHVPLRRVRPLQKRWTDRFSDEDVAAVRAADLDVILRFGFRILRGGILGTARYGVWSFHHGDNRLYRGGPALFWEMYEGNPVSGTILQILTEELDAGKVIYRSTAATDFTSWFRNRNATYWKTARFIGRRLRDLRRDGLEALIEPRQNVDASRGIYRTPRNAAMLRFLARTLWRNVRIQLGNRTKRDVWFVAYAPRPPRLIGATPRFTILDPPPGRFYADPWIAEHEGSVYLFIEDYSFATGKGVISCAELRDGKAGPPRVVLERDYHLSYPSIFQWQGSWFMTPETSDNGTVELYRASAFPWEWRLERVLLRGVNAVDPTIFRHGGGFCLFMTVIPPGGSPHDELSVFFADALDGEWRPHPRNPVVSDVRSGRPAGAPFVEDGVLYRPAQNSALCYGQSMVINRIDVLTETDYRETAVAAIEPSWLPASLCTHTLNASAHWVATDGKKKVWARRRARE